MSIKDSQTPRSSDSPPPNSGHQSFAVPAALVLVTLPSPTARGVARNCPPEPKWMLDLAIAVLDDPNDFRHVTAMAFLVEVSGRRELPLFRKHICKSNQGLSACRPHEEVGGRTGWSWEGKRRYSERHAV